MPSTAYMSGHNSPGLVESFELDMVQNYTIRAPRVTMLKNLWAKNSGVLLIISSQVFFALMNVGVKMMTTVDPPVNALELIAVRMGITYIASLAYMFLKGVEDPFLGPKGVRTLLAIRGAGGFFGLFGVYYTLEFLSLSDTIVLTYLTPMCTLFSGAVFLGEVFTRKQGIASVFSIVGIILIARPPFIFGEIHASGDQSSGGISSNPVEKGTSIQRLIAVGISLLGVTGNTVAFTCIAAVGKRAHPMHMMVSFSLLCVIVSVLLMLIAKTPVIIPTEPFWIVLLLFLGISGFIAQILLTMGLQRETAGRGAMSMYSQVIFAAASEKIVFHATPSFLSICGTIIIVCSAISVALMSKKADDGNKDIISIRLHRTSEISLEDQCLLSRTGEIDNDCMRGELVEDRLHHSGGDV